MVLIKEYRVVLPLSVEEYEIGQLYTVAQLSESETGGGDGVEILKNEHFTGKPLFNGQYSEGQYTQKVYIGKKKLNAFLTKLLPASALIILEEAWNAYPYCKTIINSEYMKDDFEIKIESLHLPGKGEIDNAHQLTPAELAHREVVFIDIAGEVARSDYKECEDPTIFKSVTTGRGPLREGWMRTADPCMTCYKLVTVKFKWFGLQSIVEKMIHRSQKNLHTLFHRQLFCLIDDWYDLSIEDIRRIEKQTQRDLISQIKKGEVRGHVQGE